MRWISSCYPFCDTFSGCGAASINIHGFRIFKIPQHGCHPLFDMSPLCPVTPGAASWTYWMRWIPSHDPIRHPWPGCGPAIRNVPHFRILKIAQRNCPAPSDIPHCSQPAVGIIYYTYSIRWISSCNPFVDITAGCGTGGTNIADFRIFKIRTAKTMRKYFRYGNARLHYFLLHGGRTANQDGPPGKHLRQTAKPDGQAGWLTKTFSHDGQPGRLARRNPDSQSVPAICCLFVFIISSLCL